MFFEFVSDCPSELQCAVCLSPFDNPVSSHAHAVQRLLVHPQPFFLGYAPTLSVSALLPRVKVNDGSSAPPCPECHGMVKGTMPAHFHALTGTS